MTNDQIIRAWKDEDYRRGLSGAELSALPAHPAGFIELSDENLVGVAGLEEESPTYTCPTSQLCTSSFTCLLSKLFCPSKILCVEEAP